MNPESTNFIYQKNMETMEKRHPEFAKLIKDTPDVDWIFGTPQLKGKDKNLRIQDSQYRELLVYNEVDKDKGSNDLADKIRAENQTGTLLFGLGTGRSLFHTLNIREPKHIVLIVEPIMHIWRIALSTYDFSDALQDGTLFPCPGPAEVEYCLAWIEGHRAIEGWNKIIDKVAYSRAEYWPLMDETMKLLNQSMGNIGTVESHGEEIALNDIGTLPWVIRHRGVKELLGLYANKPAIIVATGPSLMNNIHLLQQIQKEGTAIIIAVAQALRPLLSYDIRPDFICTVDFGEVNMSHLDGLMDSDVPLVTISKTYQPLVQAYKGPKFISATPLEGVSNTLADLLNHRGALMQGGSVLHMCVGLAACLGCNPITLIGADLSYPNKDTSHFAQTDSGGSIEVIDGMLVWKVNDPRSTLVNTTAIMGAAIYVEGYFGEDVVTNSGLHSFITTLEAYTKQAAATGVIIIDATEGGAYIKGTQRMFLQNMIDKHCKEKIDKTILEPLLALAPDGDKLILEAIPLLDHDITTLGEIIQHTERGIHYAKKSRKYWQKAELDNCFMRNAFHTKESHRLSQTILPMGYILMRALRKMESREFALTKEEEAKASVDSAVREKTVKRNIFILEAAKEGAEKLKEIYVKSWKTLSLYKAGDRDVLKPIGEARMPDLEDAEEYFKKGNFARPLLEARRILKVNPDHDDALNVQHKALILLSKAIDKGIELQEKAKLSGLDEVPIYLDLIEISKIQGRAGKDKEALEKIEEAVKLLPNKTEARWGLATMLHKKGRHYDSFLQYKILMQKEPDNLRFQFEMGQVMLQIEGRRAEGIALIRSIIKKDPATYGQYADELDGIEKD